MDRATSKREPVGVTAHCIRCGVARKFTEQTGEALANRFGYLLRADPKTGRFGYVCPSCSPKA